jgi:NADH:ubiquinone oxidoreductase subunit 6 (subunit J)
MLHNFTDFLNDPFLNTTFLPFFNDLGNLGFANILYFIYFNFIFILIILSTCYLFTLNNPVYLTFTLLFIFVCFSMVIYSFSDFLGLLIVLVYSGGLSVFFLFVCFSIKLQKVNLLIKHHSFINMVFFVLLLLKSAIYLFSNSDHYTLINTVFDLTLYVFDIRLFSNLVFITYPCLIVIMGVILLVAMLGSIGSFRQFNLKKNL